MHLQRTLDQDAMTGQARDYTYRKIRADTLDRDHLVSMVQMTFSMEWDGYTLLRGSIELDFLKES